MSKILILDIETAPAVAYVWGLYDQNIGVNQIKYDPYCLMWGAKWLHEKKPIYDALPRHKEFYAKNPWSDREIAKTARELLDEADIVVTQNGDKFDLKWLNEMFLLHNIPEPSHFYSIDLLKESRKKYYSISHKLDYRGRKLLGNSKLVHTGFAMWVGCMSGVKKDWKLMIDYCLQDILLTEKYYLRLRDRIPKHPEESDFSVGSGLDGNGRPICERCGSSKSVNLSGKRTKKSGVYQRYECRACPHIGQTLIRARID